MLSSVALTAADALLTESAEHCCTHCPKSIPVYIAGRPTCLSWNERRDGDREGYGAATQEGGAVDGNDTGF